MSDFTIKEASRKGFVPLIALYSESGCGKTLSSLFMARGLAGPTGKIVMIETENGRGELYADIESIGGYDVLRLEEPFTPQKYVEAITMIQDTGASVGIIDSASHEWEGIGGVLDMAAEKEEQSGKSGLHNWKKPKFEHAKFIQALMRTKIPIIVCLRAKYKTRQTKDKGKTVIVKDDHTSPIQAEDFIFEATCHGEILTNHNLRLTKGSHPKLKSCFPVDAPITIETGQLIQKWCQDAGRVPGSAPEAEKKAETKTEAATEEKKEPQQTADPPDKILELKTKLWTMTKKIHVGDKAALESWLKDQSIIKKTDKLETLTADQLTDAIDKSEVIITEMESK